MVVGIRLRANDSESNESSDSVANQVKEQLMPLFAIKRLLSPAQTKEEGDAMVVRAFECSLAYENFGWIRSYMEDETSMSLCIYEADSADDIWDHARRAALPINEADEAEEFTPDQFGVTPRPPIEGASLYVVDRQMPSDVSRTELDATALRAADCAEDFPGIGWVRSFWLEGPRLAHCVYWATDPNQLRAHAERSRMPCDAIRRVDELVPEQWGLPSFVPSREALGVPAE